MSLQLCDIDITFAKLWLIVWSWIELYRVVQAYDRFVTILENLLNASERSLLWPSGWTRDGGSIVTQVFSICSFSFSLYLFHILEKIIDSFKASCYHFKKCLRFKFTLCLQKTRKRYWSRQKRFVRIWKSF